MKTTKEAAAALGVKPSKLASILAKYPSYRPTATFGGRIVWDDESIKHARKITGYVELGICPHCGQRPGATTTHGVPPVDVEAMNDALGATDE